LAAGRAEVFAGSCRESIAVAGDRRQAACEPRNPINGRGYDGQKHLDDLRDRSYSAMLAVCASLIARRSIGRIMTAVASVPSLAPIWNLTRFSSRFRLNYSLEEHAFQVASWTIPKSA
jgi:hypothetical protein